MKNISQTLNGPLTKTEKNVLQRIATGKTSKEIANELFVAKGTIDKHRKNMLKKLGVKSSAQMVLVANSIL